MNVGRASSEIETALAGIGALGDDEMDLAETALMLAALERPRVALERYRLHLDDLAGGVARRAGANDPLEARAEALTQTIAQEHGYHGDELTYDDLQNANLMRVIDRRKGLPVALGVLYIHAARAQGWTAHGLNFPAHFLIALEQSGERLIIDPFRGKTVGGAGALRELLKTMIGRDAELTPAHCAALANRAVLLRLQNNIKSRLIAQGKGDQAVATVERMLLFAPNEAELWREAGVLHGELGNLGAAIAALDKFIALTPDAAARHTAAQALQILRRRLN